MADHHGTGDTDERERSPGAVFTLVRASTTAPQDRLQKCSLASVEAHRTDKSNSNKRANKVNSNSLKAQGKGVMHPVLTEVSLQHS
jgi:hypothetical protein